MMVFSVCVSTLLSNCGASQTEGGGAQGLKHPPAPWCRHGGVEEDSSGNLWSSGELHAKEV